MESGWQDHILAATDELFGQHLGPQIADDAKRYAPVRTGKLRDSIGHHLEGHSLIVEATAPYSAYVELGHRIAHGPQMREVGPNVAHPEPFLRPALYQTRGQ